MGFFDCLDVSELEIGLISLSYKGKTNIKCCELLVRIREQNYFVIIIILIM